ncbi:hypothetical protein G6F24_018731 [Rhizopus arrhizus]|nr:hypothetical protein G6F24_018731 [Rhizopus arrhizus]
MVRGWNRPLLGLSSGSSIALTAKYTLALSALAGRLKAPRACLPVPVKSTCSWPSRACTLAWITTGSPPMPSSSMRSVNDTLPSGSWAMRLRSRRSV